MMLWLGIAAWVLGAWTLMNWWYRRIWGRRLKWWAVWASHGALLFDRRLERWEAPRPAHRRQR